MIHELQALNQHPQASPHTIHGIAFGSNLTNENKVQMERRKGLIMCTHGMLPEKTHSYER
jgi:hypothetical protein